MAADRVAIDVLDAESLRRWIRAGRDALAGAREEIDALNVYPVPDRDTGTNLYLTLDAAVEALDALPEQTDLAGTLRALAAGALLGARGNSGVILSQLLRGVADVLVEPEVAGGAALCRALDHATDLAYEAVMHPVEGTVLTVARAAAESARTSPGTSLAEVARAAAEGAWAALGRTPEQLDVLRRAGVVDAGGRGLCEVLDALAGVVAGRASASSATRLASPGSARTGPGRPAATGARDVRPGPPGGGPSGGEPGGAGNGPAFEVMYLLDAGEERIPALRAALDGLGGSLLVVGGDRLWNVHVHVDDVGAAVEAGLAAGRPHRIRVTHLAGTGSRAAGRRVVAVVVGDGLATLFRESAAVVVPGGAGRRASTAEVLDGIRSTGVHEVVVLPNDADSLAVAEAAARAARAEGFRVAVVPSCASVQALAALAVHEPHRLFDDDVVSMTAAAGHARHGGVTVATRDGVTMAGVCSTGDVLGVIDGDFTVIGARLDATACTVVDRLLGGGGELVTLLVGADAEDSLAAAVVDHLHRTRPEVETVVYAGGQPRYPLLVGVE